MPSLASNLRKDLENAVKQARRAAETGAGKALDLLAVGHHEPWGSLKPEQRRLRNRLRAHGVQLGDVRDDKRGTQSVTRLTGEVAYEQWHRILFARYLAENELLIEPESGQAMSMDECRELAREQGKDWLPLACGYAEAMLPEIFRRGDPVLEVTLPPETRSELEDVLNNLPRDVFVASDSLGWVYQFWQAERKEEINKSATPRGADEIPAVTQLFTEDYMVDFLLDNTLGAWHAGKVLAENPKLPENAKSEEELRGAIALPGCPWSSLRFIRSKDGKWEPASGTFEKWPKATKSITCLDPCMGSGHFVVAMFERLVALRMAEEKLPETAAITAVIQENLFGLEMDLRCTQIGAFNLALAAWRRVGYCKLPVMNLACSGLAPNTPQADWQKIAGDNRKLQSGMERLYRLFQQAAVLGSLINPQAGTQDLLAASFHELQPLLEKVLAEEVSNDFTLENAVTAHGLAKAAEVLSSKFTLVATNVPYLGRGDQCDILKSHLEAAYPESKTDLATAFLERCLESAVSSGTVAVVVPRIWLTYTVYYEQLRKKLLTNYCWDFLLPLGKKAFRTIDGEVVDVALLAISKCQDPQASFVYLDASGSKKPDDKARMIGESKLARIAQGSCLRSPGYVPIEERASSQSPSGNKLLKEYVTTLEGISRGDTSRYDRCFWELPQFDLLRWQPLIVSSTKASVYGGCSHIFLWENGQGALCESPGARVQGTGAWGKLGIFVSRTHMNVYLTNGAAHAQNGVAIIPKRKNELLPIWHFCNSAEYRNSVLRLNQKLIKPTGVMDQVPFDIQRWQSIAAKTFPRGTPMPASEDPTQWLFNGHPKGSTNPLQVAVARLVGYKWPRQTGTSFSACSKIGSDGLDRFASPDGIVCLSAATGDMPAADRLNALLAAAYGSEWSLAKAHALLAESKSRAKTLADWLCDEFFEQHCVLFHQIPFVWHIWDGQKGGFSTLVNYHRLAGANGAGKQTLEKIIYTYLGNWIDIQRKAQKNGVEGSDALVASAEHLRKQLEGILKGESPFDLFIRWKSLERQALGWEPDIEDGVRMNIRPFYETSILRKSGRPILRFVPNINWGCDAGADKDKSKVEFPWTWKWDGKKVDFAGGNKCDGRRWNSCHYSLAAKRAARK